jgi:phosphoribosylformylglycinamidine synthase
VALAELCLRSSCGATVDLGEQDGVWALFGESTARALLTAAPADVDRVMTAAAVAGVPARVIGEVRGNHLDIAGVLRIGVDDLREVYENAIPSLMER